MFTIGLPYTLVAGGILAGKAIKKVASKKTKPILLLSANPDSSKPSDLYNPIKNAKLIKEAADAGDINAQYETGMNCIKERDMADAIHYFQLASNQGHIDAMTELGILYEGGFGSVLDNSKAFSLYQKAANAGASEANLRLGHFYRNGKGVFKDIDKALNLYTDSEEAGNSEASYWIGWIHHKEVGYKDIPKALAYYEKAADGDYFGAFMMFDVIYTHGITDHVDADPIKRAEYEKRAAECSRRIKEKKA